MGMEEIKVIEKKNETRVDQYQIDNLDTKSEKI